MYWPLTCRPKFHRLNEDRTDHIKNLYYADSNYRSNEKFHTISNRKYHAHDIINGSDVLFEIANKYLTEAIVKSGDANFDEIYNFITGLLKSVRIVQHELTDDGYKSTLSEHFNRFKERLILITDLEEDEIKPMIESNSQAEDPHSQLLHLFFDLIWSMVEIENDLTLAVTQLVYLAFKSYMRYKKNIILCDCNKSVWLKIQLHSGANFWHNFNSIMDCYDDEFCIFLTSLIARLQCYDSDGLYVGKDCNRVVDNFDFFNRHWKALIATNPDLSTITNYFKEIEDVLNELWLNSANMEFIYLTWDYFYKRLESIETGGKLLDVKASIFSEISGGSYYYFLRILTRHMERHPQHWNKFRGRVYTRFSNVKFSKLNNNGIYNLALLFVCLADVSFDEICEKLSGMLQALPDDKRNTVMVWNIYITLIQLHLNKNKSIESISTKFTQMLQSASQNRSQYHLISTYVENLGNLTTTGRPDLNQSVLIGKWIENYSKTCSTADLTTLLNALILTLECAVENNAWFEYETTYNENILPMIKRLASSTASYEPIATLATLIAINSIICESIVEYFISENIPPITTLTFLSLLCKRITLTHSNELIIKGWFRCYVIGQTNNDLNQYVYENFDDFRSFLIGLNRADNKELFKACFDNLDKYLIKHLSQHSESVYSNMAAIFKINRKLLHNRSNVNCFLFKYVNLLLLPMEVLRGIRPNENILRSIEKTWHLFAVAIYEISADDAWLERTVKDLVVKYLPHFQTNPSPFAKIIVNEKLVEFVLVRINNEFFRHGTGSVGNEHVCKALLTVQNIFEHCVLLGQIKSVLMNVLVGVFEVYMFKNQKVAVVDFLKVLIKSNWYKSGELKAIVKDCLLDVTGKHLAFNTSSYFQLVHVLAKIIPLDLKNSLGDIKEAILSMEAKRGQGFDNSLRQGLDKLQKLLCDT